MSMLDGPCPGRRQRTGSVRVTLPITFPTGGYILRVSDRHSPLKRVLVFNDTFKNFAGGSSVSECIPLL